MNKRFCNIKKGIYTVKNKNKYIGKENPNYRSSWEERFCWFCDNNKKVLKWGFENITILYYYPIDKKIHRYYLDFYCEIIDNNNNIKKYLIEVKPKKELSPPKSPKNNNKKAKKRYLIEASTYVKNQCKWKAATEYCNKRGMIFKIVTENDLFIN